MEVAKLNSSLSNLPVSKTEIRDLVLRVLGSLGESGGAIEFAVAMSSMEEFIKTLKSSPDYRELVLHEMTSDETTHRGALIKKGEFGARYDYSVCGSSRWEKLNRKIKTLDAEKKLLEEQLRMVAKGASIVDEDTGEIYSPPGKKSTTSFAVNLAR